VSGGLVGLLDDVAALAKLAAASIDDVGAAAGKASVKAAGVLIDDTAVTPAYVRGLAADRELPIIARIAKGSLKNKLIFVLPVAILLSAIAPILVEIILMCGGSYLCFEGAEKIHHFFASSGGKTAELPSVVAGPEQEEATVQGAIRTDLILSAEIMVIALKDVLDEGIVSRAAILAVVAVAITVFVYGLVALIVKMDDIGLSLIRTQKPTPAKIGRGLVLGMPKVMNALSTIGTAAMLWVGGHILLVGADELGWHWPYKQVHNLEKKVHEIGGIGGVLGWVVNTLISAIVGLAVGLAIVMIVSKIPRKNKAAASH
jgi:uncharacterized protein